MTDRFSTLTVVLEKDTRDDDAEYILNAIRMIKGVISVKGDVRDTNTYFLKERLKREYQDKIFKIFNEKED